MKSKFMIMMIVVLLVLAMGLVATAQKVEIAFWGIPWKPAVESYGYLMPKFMEENPDIRIVNVPKPGGQYEQLLKVAMATGNTPDIFRVGTWNIAPYIRQGLVAPYDLAAFDAETAAEIQDRFIPGVITEIQMKDGNLYAIPENHSTLLLVCNMDYFKEIGITRENLPTDYMEWIEVLQKLVIRENGITKRAGFEWHYNHQLWNTQELNTTLRSYGGDLLYPNGLDTRLGEPAAAGALEYVYNTVYVWKISDPHYAVTSGLGTGVETGYTATHAAGGWIKGMIDGAGVVKDWTAVRWQPGPVDTILNWAWMYGIDPNSPNQEAASKWIAFQARYDIAKYEANTYGIFRGLKGWEDWKVFQDNPDLRRFLELKAEGRYQDYTYDFLPQSKVVMTLKQNIEQKGMPWEEARQIAIEQFNEIKKKVEGN